MKYILPFLLACFSASAVYSDTTWDTDHPDWKYRTKGVVKIPEERIYEVSEAQQISVIKKLKDAGLVQLTLSEAKSLVGTNYNLGKEEMPFLVRGMYINKPTGVFTIHSYEGELLVLHESLGEAVPASKIGLIVNLVEKPIKIFVTAGTDL